MTARDRTPDPLQEPRFGVAMTGALGLFDTAGWPGVPIQTDLTDGGGGRRDYGPTGCVRPRESAIVLGLLLVASLFRRGGRRG